MTAETIPAPRVADQPSAERSDILLDVRGLKTHFFTEDGVVQAVDGVSFTLDEGETLGVVGESGSGKTVTSLSILRLLPAAARIVGGEIWFGGENLLAKSERDMQYVRGSQITMILQDPLMSLNPLFTIGDQIGEPLRIHRGMRGRTLSERIKELLRGVRIPSPEVRMREYPHQMSGGMRQRIVGAIGISCEPRLLIADEPTTALDATVQAEILDLLRALRRVFARGGAAASTASASSCMLAKRAPASNESARATISSSAGGTSGRNCDTRG